MGLGAFRRAKDKTFCSVFSFILVLSLFLPLLAAGAQPLWQDYLSSAAQRRTHPAVPEAKLALRVYNYAHLDSASLAASEKVAGAILQNVGIETIWVDCPTSQSKSRVYAACDSEMGTTDLVLRILPRHMAVKLHRSSDSLGSAQTCPETEPACELTVFYHRVDELAANGYRADRILGYAIAHEIAHVLIGPAHSEEGIMRGDWNLSDLQRISLGLSLDFSNEQSRKLRLAVLRRAATSAQEDLIQANLISH